MVYISSDGTIGEKKETKGPFQVASKGFSDLQPHWKVALLACLVFLCKKWLNPNPLANGRIPAGHVDPDQHWKTISTDDTFVRVMTSSLGSSTSKYAKNKKKSQYMEQTDKIDIAMDRVDFGGLDGHVPETGDWSDKKYLQTTRCSTTRSAITAYFCGAKVAGNQDAALESQRKTSFLGVKSLSDFIACQNQSGQRRGQYRRSVYRVGIGCQDSLAGYSHAFSIVAQPDGSFFWLQSFIEHYSLQFWMSKRDVDGTHLAHLTLEQLQAKLKQVDRLMKISSWTDQANTDYMELFGVDKEREAMDRNKPPIKMSWKPTHRLSYFGWDEACEYPVPSVSPNDNTNEAEEGDESHQGSDEFECDVVAIKSVLDELDGGRAGGQELELY